MEVNGPTAIIIIVIVSMYAVRRIHYVRVGRAPIFNFIRDPNRHRMHSLGDGVHYGESPDVTEKMSSMDTWKSKSDVVIRRFLLENNVCRDKFLNRMPMT